MEAKFSFRLNTQCQSESADRLVQCPFPENQKLTCYVQRQPSLPYTDQKRPLACAVLDTIVQYLRFNIVRKRFDVGTYLSVPELDMLTAGADTFAVFA